MRSPNCLAFGIIEMIDWGQFDGLLISDDRIIQIIHDPRQIASAV